MLNTIRRTELIILLKVTAWFVLENKTFVEVFINSRGMTLLKCLSPSYDVYQIIIFEYLKYDSFCMFLI